MEAKIGLRALGAFPGPSSIVFLSALTLLQGCGDRQPRQGAGRADSPSAGAGDRIGRLVLVGGALADDNEAVYRAVLDGRDGEGPLCVIPTASSSPRESMDDYVETFEAHGGRGVARGVFLTVDRPEGAASAETAVTLRGCSGFFFTGGSQSRIAELFLPGSDTTEAYRAVRARYLEGAVVSGSSAGAAVLSDPMIAGGSSRGALTDGLRASEDGDGVWLRQGFGFFGPGIVDQHFLARGRVARLAVAVVASPDVEWGFGIDENTALVVDGAEARVVGESGVVWVDGSDAVSEVDGPGATGLRLHLLGDGDAVDLAGGTVRVADDKAATESDDPGVEIPEDPFGEWSFLRLVADLGASPGQRVTFRVAGHRFDLVEAEAFQARAYGPGGPVGTPVGLYAGPIELSVVRR